MLDKSIANGPLIRWALFENITEAKVTHARVCKGKGNTGKQL